MAIPFLIENGYRCSFIKIKLCFYHQNYSITTDLKG